jgi:hypothetical protein
MLKLKNTISCPGCGGILRVSARVVSDGAEYLFYLCPKCEDIAAEGAGEGDWRLQGKPVPGIADLVRVLQGAASEEWCERSRSRAPLR